jgi:hypothetical protein
MNQNEGFFIGSFTLLLVIVTAWLVWATIKLWRGAEDTAQRQLRAYVFANPQGLHLDDEKKIRITYLVTNTGQTPAYDLHHFSAIRVLKWPLPEGFVIEPPKERLDPIKMSLGPAATIFGNREASWEGDIEDVSKDNERIFIIGIMRYRDAFNRERQTRFCASIANLDVAYTAAAEGRTDVPISWEYTDQHNDAD